MNKVDGDAKTIRALLGGAKFAIDYYQREYRWETKHITELLDDLTEKFLESHQEGNDRSAVELYGHYFLGSIIISNKDGRKYIIDGQQRLTSLTLLLIHLYRLLDDEEQKGQLSDLIFSQKFGKRSFNLDVPERRLCMEALFTGEPFDERGQPESVINILRRFHDIEERFPVELSGEALPYFADWLIENVHLVEITAYSDADAYTIFETMNDRGLSLTPTDMLKGYLLANITDAELRKEASHVWRSCVAELQQIDKEEDADSIKAWLRSQYAQKIRERKKNAKPEDFDRIGTEFHRWVRDSCNLICLKKSEDYFQFITRDFDFYSHTYLGCIAASRTLTQGLEPIFFNAQNGFTLQYMLLLAPLRPTDSEEIVRQKLYLVARFLDILLAWRLWNFRSITYSTMQYSMFLIMRSIRGLEPEALAHKLYERLNEEQETFINNSHHHRPGVGFYLHQQNRSYLHRILARLTDYVETQSGLPSHYAEYVRDSGRNRYEVEHIWANHPEQHEDEFDHPEDFGEQRNRIGGLLLLPKSFNASYSDLPYDKKLPHYNTQNLLARSLHAQCYQHNPGFMKLINETGLPFRPHAEFRKADLDERCELYRQLAEQVWNPADLLKDFTSGADV